MSDQIVVKRLQRETDAAEAFCCMSEVPTPWPEALHICRTWVSQNLGRYVEGYHVQLATGVVTGQLYYAPSERALVPYSIEPGVAVLYCEWVQRRYQRQGMGHHLFSTFASEMRAQGYKGILVEATEREEQMPARRYLARGFSVIHEATDSKLLYLPLSQSQVEFHPLEPHIQLRRGVPVDILVVSGYLCPFEASTQLLVADVAREFGNRVVLRHEPLSAATLQRYGVTAGVFINGRRKLSGGMTEEAIRQAILEEF